MNFKGKVAKIKVIRSNDILNSSVLKAMTYYPLESSMNG